MTSPFSEMMREAWSASGRQPTLSLFRECWTVLVGAEIAMHTRPVAWTQGALHVEVRASWRSELERRKKDIMNLMAPRLPFEPPPLLFIEGADFPTLSAPQTSRIEVPSDERTASLPEGTREVVDRILWHIRKESE